MKKATFYSIQHQQLRRHASLPSGSQVITAAGPKLLPPQITELHRSLQSWHDLKLSIGPVVPGRLFVASDNQLIVQFSANNPPQAATFTSNGRELAGWLLLLNQWMETFVVIARARTVWSVDELGTAIPFLALSYLPRGLLELTGDSWSRFSLALSTAVADGTMQGEPTNRHWQKD